MSNSHHAGTHPPSLTDDVRDATGQSAFRCYQCGKCTAGCPLGDEMDVPPSQVLRLLQFGLPEMEQEALGAYSIWLCLTCETCSSRCPQELEIHRIMEHLRRESCRRGLMHPKANAILAFQRSFLDSVRHTGRLHEVGMVAAYKLRTGHLLQDVLLAPRLFARGKLHPLPRAIEDKASIARIFERTADDKASRP